MKKTLTVALLAGAGTFANSAMAEPVQYVLDPSHSQIVFSYDHLGFSTTTGMFSGFEGVIEFDQEAPENSSVTVSMPVSSMFTGWEKRDEHFMSADFFNASASAEQDLVSFESTGIEVTGEDTALITGNLTLNNITKEVVLDAELNQVGTHPMSNTDWAGFDATTTLLRSDFGVDAAAPFVSDEVEVFISVEAEKAGA
ncbi:MAG: YceI family protein [Pseudomonadota bacterium]